MPQRLIDVPLESLPHIDEHSTYVAATPDRVWEALRRDRRRRRRLARRAARGARARLPRATRLPASRAGSARRSPALSSPARCAPAVLALMGEHRFSRYALIFCAAETASGPVRLSAETRAEFPGLKGRAYRTLVISHPRTRACDQVNSPQRCGGGRSGVETASERALVLTVSIRTSQQLGRSSDIGSAGGTPSTHRP